MRKFLLLIALITAPALAWANQSARGWCELGGQAVVTSGLNSTTTVQASYPACTVTVNVFGGGLATIFSDNSGTPLANPFTATSSGQWTFFAANGHYTVTLSGGGLPSPVTLSDILLNDPVAATSFTGTFFQSASANPAQSGVFRLASADIGLCWRNNANTADICFTKTAGDVVQLNTALTITGAFNATTGTFSSEVVPTVTGLDLGDATHRWDAFIQNLDVSGTITGILNGSGTVNTIPKFIAPATIGDSGITDNGTTVTVARDINAGAHIITAGAATLGLINSLQMCDQSISTAACQTSASTTRGMLFPPNYTIGTFTNSSNRPVFDFTRLDWPGFVTPRMFGAKGDGSTDDTAAIQAAINFVCTGSSSTTPTGNNCPSWISGSAQGGTVYLPAGQYNISAPLVLYGQVALRGAGKLATKISKINNVVGTLPSITAGTGVGRTLTSCGGGPCVDSFANDAIIQIPYISTGNTDYAYRWSIRDLSLFGSGTNGTKYGIYAPRSAQSEIKNVYIFLNCSQGAPANCGAVQGSGFFTVDSWLMRHEGDTVDSSYIGWNHANDGSNIGSGTSGIFSNDWGVNIGCSGFHFFGLSYSSMIANAVDNYNKKGTDLANVDLTCVPYAFTSVSGLSINGGGAENLTGGVMYAASSSIVISGGFKTFTQTGYTSAGTLATLFMDQTATVTMNGTSFSAVTSPGNIFNIVLQGGSTLIDNNSVLPTGGSTFISYAGGSTKIDTGNGGITLTNGSGTRTSTPTTDTFSPQKIANGTAAMTTVAIAAGACGTTVTVAATGVVSTDSIVIANNAAVAANPGVLIVNKWPTANNVNFNYCNPTAASVTPSAATLNWRVIR